MITRLAVPAQLEEWWGNLPAARFNVVLRWRENVTLHLGTLQTEPYLFRYEPRPGDDLSEEDLIGKKDKLDRIFAKPLTRAGLQRPWMDPEALWRLQGLRAARGAQGSRLDFIFDTNAMVDGVGHWLAMIFADRCDLVVTAVTLRELQDQADRAKFAAALGQRVQEKSKEQGKDKKTSKDDEEQVKNKEDKWKWKIEADVLGPRHTYLAASRFREFHGCRRVVWRELEMDDTALLLSRGGGGNSSPDKKTSESDTVILRAVRRSIKDRVNGLERFFVTGDAALARRAATELPSESIIHARVRNLERGRVYSPCRWWPGPDEGQALTGIGPGRLVWELLAIADEVGVVPVDPAQGTGWHFTWWDEELWASDFIRPWIKVDGAALGAAETPLKAVDVPVAPIQSVVPIASSLTSRVPETPVALPTASSPTVSEVEKPTPATQTDPVRAEPLESIDEFLFPFPADIGPSPALDDNLRIGATLLLNALGAIATGSRELQKQVDHASGDVAVHLRRLLAHLALTSESPQATALQAAWLRGDVEWVANLLRSYSAFGELIEPPHGPRLLRPKDTEERVQALAVKLGQGLSLRGEGWLPGGANPSLRAVREAIVAHFAHGSDGAYPVFDLFMNVFLRKLGVSPVRAMGAWDRMERAGIFADIELRRGGSSSGKRVQKWIALTPTGWTEREDDLESFRGYRDLLDRRGAHG